MAHHLTISFDTEDPRAVIAFIAAAVADWPDDRLAALKADVDLLIKEKKLVDFAFSDGCLTCTMSPDLLDLLRRHGVGGAKFGELP